MITASNGLIAFGFIILIMMPAIEAAKTYAAPLLLSASALAMVIAVVLYALS